MTIEEARALLGVEDEAEAVRRAYLQLLRHYKPDADPRGFVRLREAYDLVSSTLQKKHEPEEVAPDSMAPGQVTLRSGELRPYLQRMRLD